MDPASTSFAEPLTLASGAFRLWVSSQCSDMNKGEATRRRPFQHELPAQPYAFCELTSKRRLREA